MIEHPPKVLASGEKAITSGCSARSQISAEVHKEHSHLLKTCVCLTFAIKASDSGL